MSLICGVIRRAQVVDLLAVERSSSMQSFSCALHDVCSFLSLNQLRSEGVFGWMVMVEGGRFAELEKLGELEG